LQPLYADLCTVKKALSRCLTLTAMQNDSSLEAGAWYGVGRAWGYRA
jgi:hypothetical protein